MRHAKSDWSTESTSDHDRPLNDRGIRDAPAMAGWIADSGFLPDLVLCSSAKRTQQTAALLFSFWKHTGWEVPGIVIAPDLYLSSAETVFEVIARESAGIPEGATATPRTMLVLAHNPGISHAASIVAGHAVGLPTAALVVVKCGVADWSVPLSSDVTQWVAEMKPKSLAGEGR